MWLFYLYDGNVLATTSEYQVAYIEETYDVRVITFTDDLDYGMSVCDYVIE